MAALQLGSPECHLFVLGPEAGVVLVPGAPFSRHHLGGGGEGEVLLDDGSTPLRSASPGTKYYL